MTDPQYQDAKELLQKYRQGTCTAAEKQLVEDWYASLKAGDAELPDEVLRADIAELRGRLQRIGRKKRHNLGWVSAAAAVLLVVLGLSYYQVQQRRPVDTPPVTDRVIDPTMVAPGGNVATLTLGDGRTISLSDAANGLLDSLGGVKVSKTADGQIVYAANGPSDGPATTNTVNTPRGGQYQLQLPDGSKVWLNAASSLTYTTSFAKERKVILTGEAFFDVTHNAALPFMVKTADQEITVLGTRFNIKAYADEGGTATVLERGSVRVTATGDGDRGPVILKPGQQSLLSGAGDITVSTADMETALAWQRDEIRFKDASLDAVLREASRWYNVEIVYNGRPTKELFTGGIKRSSNLAALLKILELNGLRCQVSQAGAERKLIVNQ